MAGIDRLISTSLSKIIKKKLNADERKNIERKLFLEYGMSIKLSIEHFSEFSKTLGSIFNGDKKKFENECINEIIKIKKIDENYSIKIIDQNLSDLILKLSGDNETRRILVCLFDNELTIPQIIKESNVPKHQDIEKLKI